MHHRPDQPVRTGREIERASFDELSNHVLYEILRLRSAVFVVEQDCVYLDIDGRDREPATEHLWVRDTAGVAATLRLLDEGGGTWSIGRVVTRPDARSTGVASHLMTDALAALDARGCARVTVSAQAHLEHWYGRFGFTTYGPGYLEDGIPHVPMERRPT